MKHKTIFKNDSFEKTLGYEIESIMKLFDHFSSSRLPYERMWKLLDAYDSGEFWNQVAKVLPNYSIRPDTNWINWAKENYVNSLYVGTYRGDVFCREAKYEEYTLAINEFLEYIFNKLKINSLQAQAGERAALLNFGAIEFGWNSQIIKGSKDHRFTGEVEAKFIDNMSLFMDPSAKNYKLGQAMFIAEEISLAELFEEPLFKDRISYFIEHIQKNQEYVSSNLSEREYGKGYYGTRSRTNKDNTLRLLTCYYKHIDKNNKRYRLDKIWILEDGFVLNVKTDLKPKEFPVKVLYSNRPIKDPYGIPKTKLILNNVLTINLLDSIDATMVYKALERAKIVSRKAGLNENVFARDGDKPNKLFVVDGDPNNVVRYVDLPDLPSDRHLLKQRLELGIMRVTGIDDVYTGSDTNSIQTTGGMDLLNQRVTLRDNSRITLLQEFILDITEYILLLYLNNGDNREFPRFNSRQEFEGYKEIKFEDMRNDEFEFDFTCDITPNLPNNVQRRAETANILMEKQMQYNFNPQLISPEEWVTSQDFPQKYKILQRLRQERMRDDMEDIEAELINYSGLVQKGVRPDAAVKMLASERQAKRDNPSLGNTGNANGFQDRQAG